MFSIQKEPLPFASGDSLLEIWKSKICKDDFLGFHDVGEELDDDSAPSSISSSPYSSSSPFLSSLSLPSRGEDFTLVDLAAPVTLTNETREIWDDWRSSATDLGLLFRLHSRLCLNLPEDRSLYGAICSDLYQVLSLAHSVYQVELPFVLWTAGIAAKLCSLHTIQPSLLPTFDLGAMLIRALSSNNDMLVDVLLYAGSMISWALSLPVDQIFSKECFVNVCKLSSYSMSLALRIHSMLKDVRGPEPPRGSSAELFAFMVKVHSLVSDATLVMKNIDNERSSVKLQCKTLGAYAKCIFHLCQCKTDVGDMLPRTLISELYEHCSPFLASLRDESVSRMFSHFLSAVAVLAQSSLLAVFPYQMIDLIAQLAAPLELPDPSILVTKAFYALGPLLENEVTNRLLIVRGIPIVSAACYWWSFQTPFPKSKYIHYIRNFYFQLCRSLSFEQMLESPKLLFYGMGLRPDMFLQDLNDIMNYDGPVRMITRSVSYGPAMFEGDQFLPHVNAVLHAVHSSATPYITPENFVRHFVEMLTESYRKCPNPVEGQSPTDPPTLGPIPNGDSTRKVRSLNL